MGDSVMDLDEFLERVQDDKELILELVDIFTEDYQIKRKSLEEAVESKNYEEIISIGHSLKGATANISAKPLREICMKFEQMGKENNVEGAQELLVKLDEQFKLLEERISSLKVELK